MATLTRIASRRRAQDFKASSPMRHCSPHAVEEPLTSESSIDSVFLSLLRECTLTVNYLHRGARHGLSLGGKLSRIEEQERQLLANYSDAFDANTATEVSQWYAKRLQFIC